MSEEWIGLDAHGKLLNWCWTTFLTAALAAYAWLEAASTWPGRWWAVGVIGLIWLAMVGYRVNRCYGRTLLTTEGMRFHTFMSRRVIRWADVVQIRRDSHSVRGFQWWDVRVVRREGRPLRVPGARTTTRSDRDFDRKLRRIRKFQAAAKV